MHIAISAIVVLLIWYKGIWRDRRQYHTTMLFSGFIQLLYDLIVETSDYFLWRISPDLHITRVPTISLYVFIILPGTTLLYLSKFPEGVYKQIIHISKWVFIYGVIEWIGHLYNKINYFNGWKFWHSIIFDIILFLGLILHYKKPFISYIVFILVTILGIWRYRIPIY